MITELMDYSQNMMLSIDIVPIGMDDAIKMVDKVTMPVDSDANCFYSGKECIPFLLFEFINHL